MDAIFISFEGGEGVGKSTQIRLLATRLLRAGYEVCCVRDPGGTYIGEQIRRILLDTSNTGMTLTTELLLYEAARSQLVAEVIQPNLDEGKIVLVDRFTDSTIAYQVYARGFDRELATVVNDIGSVGLTPTRTVLLEQNMEVGLSKATQEGADRMEAEGSAFHQKVHDGFERLAREYPERIIKVTCQDKKEDTHERVFAAVSDLFNERAKEPFLITEHVLQESRQL